MSTLEHDKYNFSDSNVSQRTEDILRVPENVENHRVKWLKSHYVHLLFSEKVIFIESSVSKLLTINKWNQLIWRLAVKLLKVMHTCFALWLLPRVCIIRISAAQ